MSNELIEDWLYFCDGKKDFAVNHFYTMFMEEVSKTDIEKIFSIFPQKAELTDRLNRLKNSNVQVSVDDDRRAKSISDLVLLDLQEKKKVCQLFGEQELVTIIENGVIQFVEEDDYYSLKDEESSWPMEEVMVFLGDYFREELGDYSKVESALMEATYEATNDYNLVWYMLAPFAGSQYKTNFYIELWELGAEYFLSEKNIYIWDRLR